jgi:hypothetical protein
LANRWYLNLRARSPISADIRLRNLAHYCDLNKVSPEDILEQAQDNNLKNNFQDFVNKIDLNNYTDLGKNEMISSDLRNNDY